MASELGRIGPIVIRTYTLLLDIMLVGGLVVLGWQGHRQDGKAGAWIDTGLMCAVGGVIGGRLIHVALYAAYFRENPVEILRVWHGGIDWHGAVIGGLVALVIAALQSRVRFRAFTDVLTFLLPAGAALIYTGCWMTSCGHGREVTSLAAYPPLIAQELPDLFGVMAPRLASQMFGLIWSLILLGVAALLARRITIEGVRLWPILALTAAGAFAIAFTRGDAITMIGPLRVDQVLDVGMFIVGVVGFMFARRQAQMYTLYGPAGFIRRNQR
jgi:phosphatidylglycerol:prolipoprotein diacylglycerol transferase